MTLINGVKVDTRATSEYNHNTFSSQQYTNNIFLNPRWLERYLCDTIKQSLDSIDEALAIKDYDIINTKLKNI